jgi:hypothetical protein
MNPTWFMKPYLAARSPSVQFPPYCTPIQGVPIIESFTFLCEKENGMNNKSNTDKEISFMGQK